MYICLTTKNVFFHLERTMENQGQMDQSFKSLIAVLYLTSYWTLN